MRAMTILLFLSCLLLVPGCRAQQGHTIDVAALQLELSKTGVQLVDVRTPQEWTSGHIEGALHIDWFADDFKARIDKLDRSKPVRLYCAAGGRSEEARELLREMGFKDVLDLDGGIGAWKKAGAPIVR